MSKKRAILHLSDIHISDFIEKYTSRKVSSNFSKYQKYSDVFLDDLTKYLEENNLQLMTTIIAGDLANNGENEDYSSVKILLEKIKNNFKLDCTDILIVPGNHDINWFDNETALRKDGHSKKEYEYHDEKFKNFKSFFDDFYSNPAFTFKPENAISIVKTYPDESLCFIGLNSNYKESFMGTDHYGFIYEDSLDKEIRTIIEKYPNFKIIAFWHHNPVYIEDESKTLKNWSSILHILSNHNIHNYLFGHTHKDESKSILYKESYSYFSIGSFGKLDSTVTNSYNLFIEENIKNEYARFNRALFKFMPSDSDLYRKTGYWEEQKNIKDQKELVISLEKGYSPSVKVTDKEKASPLIMDYKTEGSFEEDRKKELEAIIKSNEEVVIDILKNKKLVKSGHFHWSGDRKTRTWIDTNMLFSDNKVLDIIRTDFITKLTNIKNELQIDFNLIMGLGIEGNVLASPLSVIFNCYYSYFPIPTRNDHNSFEKELIDGSFKNIVFVTDVVFEGSTIKDFINKQLSFFKDTETIVILSVFLTGGNSFDAKSFEKEFNKKFHFRYLTNKIQIEKCNLDAEECSVCKLNLENIYQF